MEKDSMEVHGPTTYIQQTMIRDHVCKRLGGENQNLLSSDLHGTYMFSLMHINTHSHTQTHTLHINQM